MLIKFDLFFAVTFSIQFLVLQLEPNDPEFAVTIVAIAVAIILSGFAIWAARNENKPVMITFIILLLLTIAYFAFKIARIYQPTLVNGVYVKPNPKYQYTFKYLTFFGGCGTRDERSKRHRPSDTLSRNHSGRLHHRRARVLFRSRRGLPKLWRGTQETQWVGPNLYFLSSNIPAPQ
jgi:hypothetical protein